MSSESANHNGSATRHIKRLLVAAATVLSVVIALWLAGKLIWRVTLGQAYGYLVATVSDASGLPTRLIAAGVLLAVVIPVLLGAVRIFDRDKRVRQRSYALIAMYVAVYNVGVYYATYGDNFRSADGAPLKYCARTPAGLYCAERPGVDPHYGIRMEPMIPDKIAELEGFDVRIRTGNIDPIEISRGTPAFDPATGQPVLYYTRDDTGAYRWFGGPGFDVHSGEEARPATKDVLRDHWQRQEVHAAATAEREAQARQQAVQQVAAAARDARKAMLTGLLRVVGATPNDVDVAVAIQTESQDEVALARVLTDGLARGLSSARVHGNFIRSVPDQAAAVASLYSGNASILREARALGLLSGVDRFVVGRLTAECAPGHLETTRCELRLETHAIDGDGNSLDVSVNDDIAAGFSRKEAMREGVQRLAELLSADARGILRL